MSIIACQPVNHHHHHHMHAHRHRHLIHLHAHRQLKIVPHVAPNGRVTSKVVSGPGSLINVLA